MELTYRLLSGLWSKDSIITFILNMQHKNRGDNHENIGLPQIYENVNSFRVDNTIKAFRNYTD